MNALNSASRSIPETSTIKLSSGGRAGRLATSRATSEKVTLGTRANPAKGWLPIGSRCETTQPARGGRARARKGDPTRNSGCCHSHRWRDYRDSVETPRAQPVDPHAYLGPDEPELRRSAGQRMRSWLGWILAFALGSVGAAWNLTWWVLGVSLLPSSPSSSWIGASARWQPRLSSRRAACLRCPAGRECPGSTTRLRKRTRSHRPGAPRSSSE